jgi:hypothetical protein
LHNNSSSVENLLVGAEPAAARQEFCPLSTLKAINTQLSRQKLYPAPAGGAVFTIIFYTLQGTFPSRKKLTFRDILYFPMLKIILLPRTQFFSFGTSKIGSCQAQNPEKSRLKSQVSQESAFNG